MRQLKSLSITYGELEDIGPLAELEHIEFLTLRNNKISDLSPLRGCCKTKINMQCYESEKLAEHAVDSDFDHTNEAVPALYL